MNVKRGGMGFRNNLKRPGEVPHPSRLRRGDEFCSIFINHKKRSGRLVASLSLQIIKEETMKKFICIAVAFMLMLIFIGCSATMTPEQRKETYDLRGSVGNQPFVGDPNNLDARGMFKGAWW